MSTQLKSKIAEQIVPSRNPDAAGAKGWITDTLGVTYDFNDATADILIPASAAQPVYLLEVLNLMTAALSGGTATVDIGDGTTVGKYIANAAITEATVGDLVHSVVGAKLVANATIRVTIGAGNSAGAGACFVRIFRPA
jgi:hypothetical protein